MNIHHKAVDSIPSPPAPADDHPFNPFPHSRVAVTGGTSGLGLALVRELLNHAAEVALAARGQDRVKRVVQELSDAHGIVGDVSLGDTECEDFERALATNVLGPFRLTKALLGSLAASAREGRGAVVVNVSSDAAANAYQRWGAYGASKAALLHLSRIWDEELRLEGVRVLSIDPGDMDTPLHAAAVPDADRSTLKRPEVAARELADAVAAVLSRRVSNLDSDSDSEAIAQEAIG